MVISKAELLKVPPAAFSETIRIIGDEILRAYNLGEGHIYTQVGGRHAIHALAHLKALGYDIQIEQTHSFGTGQLSYVGYQEGTHYRVKITWRED